MPNHGCRLTLRSLEYTLHSGKVSSSHLLHASTGAQANIPCIPAYIKGKSRLFLASVTAFTADSKGSARACPVFQKSINLNSSFRRAIASMIVACSCARSQAPHQVAALIACQCCVQSDLAARRRCLLTDSPGQSRLGTSCQHSGSACLVELDCITTASCLPVSQFASTLVRASAACHNGRPAAIR